MAPPHSPSHDMPGGDAVAVMDLFQSHPSVCESVLHRGGVRDGRDGIRVQRFEQNADASLS